MWGLKTSEGLFWLKQNPILVIRANAGYWHDGSQLGEIIDKKAKAYKDLGIEVVKVIEPDAHIQNAAGYYDFLMKKIAYDQEHGGAPDYADIDLGKIEQALYIHDTGPHALEFLKNVVTDPTINKIIWMVTLNQFAGKEEAHERLYRGDIDLFEATKIMGKAAKANAVSEHFHGGLEFHPRDYQWMGSPKGGLLYCRQKLVAGWEAGYGRQQGED